MLADDLYQRESVESWSDLVSWYNRFHEDAGSKEYRWVFRGQGSHTDPQLATSIERIARDYELNLATLRKREMWLLKEFERRLHHYVSDTPKPDDIIEWLALMQHFGSPTRLHDWSYSFYVACFFAVQNARGKPCEIWAMNTRCFDERKVLDKKFCEDQEKAAKELLKASGSYTDDHWRPYQNLVASNLLVDPKPLVFAVNPLRLNERLTIQQGVFIFPGDISRTLEANIAAAEYESDSKSNLLRLEIAGDIKLQKEVLTHLYRMNIDSATLFPGLSGFGESLRTRAVFLPELVASYEDY